MTRTLAVVAAIGLFATTILGQNAPRLVIVGDSGSLEDPHKVFFGSGAFFYAVPAEVDLAAKRFHPRMALSDVEWWAYRTHDLRGDARPTSDGNPGFEVSHRLRPRRLWDPIAIPYVWPDELRQYWSSGRYVVQASAPGRGRATLRVIVATLLLHEFDAEIDAKRFEATFHIGLADPEMSAMELPMQVETLDKDRRRVSRLGGGKLVRFDHAYRTPRKVRVSSRVTAEQVAARAADARWSILRAVPDGVLRITIGDRVFEFPLPIEEGLLVQRMKNPPWGHEGQVLYETRSTFGRPERAAAGSSGRSRKKSSRTPNRNQKVRPHDRARVEVVGDGETWGSNEEATHRDPEIEIVSSAGRGKRLKVWMGEPVSFAARKRPTGIDDVFRPTRWLRDVYWTLVRTSVPTTPPLAIIPGSKSAEVGRNGPSGFWGDPPSIFECPDDVLGNWKPGRYVLTAARPGGASAAVRVDLAAFEIIDVNADLTPKKYAASMRFQLTDPGETRNRIPIAVRIVSSGGEIRDLVRGVALSRDLARRHTFRSGRIYVSTTVKDPCRDRYGNDEKAEKASNGPPVLKVTPDSMLLIRLDEAAFRYPLPLTVETVWVGRSGATDKPAGR